MAGYFGKLFMRCATNNYKTRIYINVNTKREFRVRTLCQMAF